MRGGVSRIRLLLLLPGLLAWVLGSSATLVHEVVVLHVECVEHGETVELDRHAEASAPSADAPTIGAAPLDLHDDGCFLDGVSLAGVKGLPPRPYTTRTALHVEEPRAVPGAPRGPPLEYAPKTSPPHRA